VDLAGRARDIDSSSACLLLRVEETAAAAAGGWIPRSYTPREGLKYLMSQLKNSEARVIGSSERYVRNQPAEGIISVPVGKGEGNITTLRGRGPHRGPRPGDGICQTRTLAHPRRRCDSRSGGRRSCRAARCSCLPSVAARGRGAAARTWTRTAACRALCRRSRAAGTASRSGRGAREFLTGGSWSSSRPVLAPFVPEADDHSSSSKTIMHYVKRILRVTIRPSPRRAGPPRARLRSRDHAICPGA
jgi:hypothetical protein